MAVKIKTKYGLIDISNSVIATVVGGAATSNYGVVGMASKNALRDGAYTILNRENYRRGVVIKTNDNQIVVDVYIIVGYGLKISEVSHNVQDSVKYNLENLLGIKTKSVTVFSPVVDTILTSMPARRIMSIVVVASISSKPVARKIKTIFI